MNYSLEELSKANNLLRAMFSFLDLEGLISGVDVTQIDYTASAFRALEHEFLEGPEEEDNTREGLCRRGVRHVCSAVYLDGTPVIGTESFFDVVDFDSFAFWSDDCPIGDYFTGTRQIIHSDLMVLHLSEIKPNSQYFEYCRGKLGRRMMVESVDSVSGQIYFFDLANWERHVIKPSDYGIVPYKDTGLWNTGNWLEFIDTSVPPTE